MTQYLMYSNSDTTNYFTLGTNNLWLTYSSFTLKWAYLYKTAAPLWVTPWSGTASGNVFTGDQIVLNLEVTFTNSLMVDTNDPVLRAGWSLIGPSLVQLYLDLDQTAGQPIPLDSSPLYIYVPFITVGNQLQSSYLSIDQYDPLYISAFEGGTPIGWFAGTSDGAAVQPALSDADDKPKRPPEGGRG